MMLAESTPINRHVVKTVARLLICLAIVFGAQTKSFAQAKRPLLSLVVENTTTGFRSNAPISINCRLEYTANRLLEGHLRMEFRDGMERVGAVRVDDIVLTGGDYEFTAMIPPMKAPFKRGIDLFAYFETSEDTINLTELPLPLLVPSDTQRTVVAMFVGDAASKTLYHKQLSLSLNIDRYNSYRNLSDEETPYISGAEQITYYPTMVDFQEVPVLPIRYCCFDLVVVAEGYFGRLREKQLTALGQWIQAGGAACIIPDGRLEKTHTGFLNTLADVTAKDGSAPFLLDDEQQLAERNFGRDEFQLHQYGLGRVAIGSPNFKPSLMSPEAMGKLNAFLWRIRNAHQEVRDGKAWSVPIKPKDPKPGTAEFNRQQQARAYGYDGADDFRLSGYSYESIPSVSGLLRQTMPANVKIVPFHIVGLLLLLYVIAIGPGDYMLLGLLKMRKYTWIVFPLVTLAFTLFTVWLSHRYMGSSEPGQPVVFLDVVEDNKIARSNTLSLIFSGSQQTVTTDIDGAISTGIDYQQFGALDPGFNRPNQGAMGTYSLPAYAGRFPTNYRMIQKVSQWTPHLSRTLQIAPESKPLKFDFDAEVGAAWIKAGALRTRDLSTLQTRIQSAFGKDVSAVIYHNEKILPFCGSMKLFNQQITTPNDPYAINQYQYQYTKPAQRYPYDILHELCARSPINLFRPLYQISPNGGGNFEDMTLVDLTDENQLLLAIIVEEEGQFRVYRRLYFVNEDGITAEENTPNSN